MKSAMLWTEGFRNTLNRATSIYFIQGEETRLIKIGHVARASSPFHQS